MIEPMDRDFEIDLEKVNHFIKKNYGNIDNKNTMNKIAYMMSHRDASFLRGVLRGQKKLPGRPFAFLFGACHMMGVKDFRELIAGMKQLECELKDEYKLKRAQSDRAQEIKKKRRRRGRNGP